MAWESSAELLALHGVRILGMADTDSVARRFSLSGDTVEELLLDDQARGWVQRVRFADLHGWSLTAAGRAEDTRILSAELDEAGARDTVTRAHASFRQLNGRLLELITNWQIRPTRADPMATNDHSDWRWDTDILKSLTGLVRRLRPVADDLTQTLSRFAGYSDRLATALDRVERGERNWVDGPGIDSCHTVWFQLHEDLIATLGLERGRDSSA